MENEKNEVTRLSDSRDSSKRRMFKAAFQIGIFLSFALIFSLQSCGSKSSSSNGSDDNNGLSSEFGTSTDSENKKGYEIVPLVWTSDTTVNTKEHDNFGMYDRYKLGRYFTLKDSKGDYIVFDNDEDYIEYCPEIRIIQDIYWDYDNKWEENMGISGERYKLRKEELNKAYEYIERLINGVDRYFSGNKEDISDPELFEQIDKYYYNNKDYLFDFYCLESKYNEKNYPRADDTRRCYMTVIPRKEAEHLPTGYKDILFTINGEDIPSNAVVIYYY